LKLRTKGKDYKNGAAENKKQFLDKFNVKIELR
jgi:hypothetical protein